MQDLRYRHRKPRWGLDSLASLGLALLAALLAAALAQAKPGDLDRSFGGDGKVAKDFCPHSRYSSVAIDHRGRTVVAGANPHSGKFCLARLRRNGHFDRSFSGDGKVTTDFGGAAVAHAVAIDSRGRIVATGGYGRYRGQLTSAALARYKPNGSLDRSFSGDGKTTTPFGGLYVGGRCEGSCHDHAHSVAIDSRDRIVIAGKSFHDFGIARYKWNGNLDGSFGFGGKVKTDFGGGDVARSLAIDPRGRIVAAGNAGDEFALARYEADGSLDSSFGSGGRVTTAFGSPPLRANSMATYSRRRIVVAGQRGAGGYGRKFALARYRQGGGLDPSFGDGGKVITVFPNRSVGATSVAIDSRGRIAAAGGKFDLARYKPNGRADRSFSGNGKVTTGWSALSGNSVAIDSRDRIVVAGWRSKLLLARFIG